MEQASIYKSAQTRAEIEALYDRARDRLPFATESRMVETTFGSTHVLAAGPVDGRTKVVSERFVQWAKRCIPSVVRPSASWTTATGLPR